MCSHIESALRYRPPSRMSADSLRHDWTIQEALAIHDQPLLSLLFRAQSVHREHHEHDTVQLATLVSVKTGGCPEDCAYCPQSSKYDTAVGAERMMSIDEVVARARAAKSKGATRFCMGAAWREVKDGPAFDRVIEMVRQVKRLGMEACCTLGMLSESQAQRLKEAGLDMYNHNLDTSREFYGSIIHTRTYEDRLRTLNNVRAAGIGVCCGGIIGMGESVRDRVAMLVTLANMAPHPNSVPINALVAVEGTPLQAQKPVEPIELVRMIATARVLMPKSTVRLSAGRTRLSQEAQWLCFMAGANSIFYGEKLLTTPNPDVDQDAMLLRTAGLRAAGPTSVDVSIEHAHPSAEAAHAFAHGETHSHHCASCTIDAE
jgi:biotin synthase